MTSTGPMFAKLRRRILPLLAACYLVAFRVLLRRQLPNAATT